MEILPAVKVVLRRADGRILVLERSADHKTNPNCLEFLGGSYNPDVETVMQGAEREALEETNLRIGVGRRVGLVREMADLGDGTQEITTEYREGRILDGELRLSSEHTRFEWLYFSEIAARENLSSGLRIFLRDFVVAR